MKGLANKQYLVGTLGANTASAMPELGAGNILSDSADEFQTPQAGNNDEPSFKAYTIRWMTVAGQLVPSIQDQVKKILSESAAGAAGQCIGKAPGCAECSTPAGYSLATPGAGSNWCGRRWYQSSWDGFSGMGEQMSAMSVFQNSLAFMDAPGGPGGGSSGGGGGGGAASVPFTSNTGGQSESKPNAGSDVHDLPTLAPITTADRAGAYIMMIGSLALTVVGLWFMMTE